MEFRYSYKAGMELNIILSKAINSSNGYFKDVETKKKVLDIINKSGSELSCEVSSEDITEIMEANKGNTVVIIGGRVIPVNKYGMFPICSVFVLDDNGVHRKYNIKLKTDTGYLKDCRVNKIELKWERK